MRNIVCRVCVCESSLHRLCPIIIPGNSREDSEHKKQHWDGGCAFFESPVGFPTEFLRSATNVILKKIQMTQARCTFDDIPPGTYAIVVIHDENMNDELDTNWLGVPSEGYGFSNDAKALLGAPSFSAASFPYDRHDLELTISLHY